MRNKKFLAKVFLWRVDRETIHKKAPSHKMDWVQMPLPDLLTIYAGCASDSVEFSTPAVPPEKALRLML
jgi:hypothetical protein